jgi:hypothetical protein
LDLQLLAHDDRKGREGGDGIYSRNYLIRNVSLGTFWRSSVFHGGRLWGAVHSTLLDALLPRSPVRNSSLSKFQESLCFHGILDMVSIGAKHLPVPPSHLTCPTWTRVVSSVLCLIPTYGLPLPDYFSNSYYFVCIFLVSNTKFFE